MFIAGKIRLIKIIISLLFIPFLAFSQAGKLPIPEQKAEARELYDSGDYSGAYEIYKSLLERYPKDGQFNYYSGICLYKLNKDLPKAIEYLDYSSSKPQVPGDVFYHLGQAYVKNFQFTRARSSFEKFSQIANRNEIRQFQPDLKVQNTTSAMELTRVYNPFEVIATSLFTFSDTNYVNQVRGKGGHLEKKSEEFLTKNEDQGELTNFMFMPKNISKGQYVYFSGYSRSGKKNSQIFRIKKNNGKNWGTPEEIKELNSDYDEILPYFDPVSNDLYFSSMGHNSMGGFDIFKSHYDSDRDEWSAPINLGFPVNSPENDLLAMPGTDLGNILLITDRQGLDSMLTVYKLVLKEPKKSLANADNEELKRIGNLGGISAIPAIIDLTDLKEPEKPAVDNNKNNRDDKVSPEKDISAGSYEANIATALAYQKKSDSLSMLAKETRIKVRSMHNPDDRWAWQRQIIEWEKTSTDYREKADKIFAGTGAVTIQQQNRNNTAEIPPAIEKKQKVNDITVYRYKEENQSSLTSSPEANEENIKDIPGDEQLDESPFNTKDEPGEVIIPPGKRSSQSNRFVILNKSPYNDNNPFPVDTEIPAGIFYKIQLGVFSEKIDYDTFGGITPVTAESVPGKDLTRFFAGKFDNYEDAKSALEKVRQQGFRDSYIVSWYNGQKTAVSKVIELEKRDQP